jgi:hypothetical protein
MLCVQVMGVTFVLRALNVFVDGDLIKKRE